MSLPEKLIWNNALSVGDPTIDEEHLQMVNAYNELIDLTKNGKINRKNFASILSKLTDFSLYHFKNEEKYMQKINYPNFEEHRKLHKEYIYKVALFNSELLTINPPNPEEIIQFIKNWLDNHIFKEDIKYVNFINERGKDVKY